MSSLSNSSSSSSSSESGLRTKFSDQDLRFFAEFLAKKNEVKPLSKEQIEMMQKVKLNAKDDANKEFVLTEEDGYNLNAAMVKSKDWRATRRLFAILCKTRGSPADAYSYLMNYKREQRTGAARVEDNVDKICFTISKKVLYMAVPEISLLPQAPFFAMVTKIVDGDVGTVNDLPDFIGRTDGQADPAKREEAYKSIMKTFQAIWSEFTQPQKDYFKFKRYQLGVKCGLKFDGPPPAMNAAEAESARKSLA